MITAATPAPPGSAGDHHPRPLPIRPRPIAGEPIAGYVRRLARANHLRPSYLRRYLHDPGPAGGIRMDWLAILSGRPAAALERAFTPAPHRQDRRPGPGGHRRSRADLFAAIRRDASQSGSSVRALSDRHGVHRRTVLQALASPVPAPRKRPPPRPSRLDPFKDTIDAIVRQEQDNPGQPACSVKEIFDRLVAEHGATGISYSTLRGYVSGIRPRPRRTRIHPVLPATPPSSSPAQAADPSLPAWSPAHLAVEHQDLPRLRDLLDAGHDVEDDNGDGWSLLHHTIDSECDAHLTSGQPLHADITAFLLARGADPHRPRNGVPALTEAENRGHWLAAEIMKSWSQQGRAC
jgi:hypothetical protein